MVSTFSSEFYIVLQCLSFLKCIHNNSNFVWSMLYETRFASSKMRNRIYIQIRPNATMDNFLNQSVLLVNHAISENFHEGFGKFLAASDFHSPKKEISRGGATQHSLTFQVLDSQIMQLGQSKCIHQSKIINNIICILSNFTSIFLS